MNKNLYNKKAEIFKALANPVRLEIIDVLLDGEKCVCEIIEKLNNYEQPHISKSLAKLKSVVRRLGFLPQQILSNQLLKTIKSSVNLHIV